jgi:CheY-like chemotaxis protein
MGEASLRVLLVNNSRHERDRYAEALRRAGYCTLLADNAADAYRLASELAPAVVVTGIHLGGGDDGFELTRHLKRDERTRNLRVVILSANGVPGDRDEATHSGCDAFLVGPCPPSALAHAVEEMVSAA